MPKTRGGTMVVAHYRDGRLLKGATSDFSPDRPEFHLVPNGGSAGSPSMVRVSELKALFFVRSFEGDDFHVPDEEHEPTGPGRRVEVTFADGEFLEGVTLGYNRQKAGFFLTPADASGNNERVFIPHHPQNRLRWP